MRKWQFGTVVVSEISGADVSWLMRAYSWDPGLAGRRRRMTKFSLTQFHGQQSEKLESTDSAHYHCHHREPCIDGAFASRL